MLFHLDIKVEDKKIRAKFILNHIAKKVFEKFAKEIIQETVDEITKRKRINLKVDIYDDNIDINYYFSVFLEGYVADIDFDSEYEPNTYRTVKRKEVTLKLNPFLLHMEKSEDKIIIRSTYRLNHKFGYEDEGLEGEFEDEMEGPLRNYAIALFRKFFTFLKQNIEKRIKNLPAPRFVMHKPTYLHKPSFLN